MATKIAPHIYDALKKVADEHGGVGAVQVTDIDGAPCCALGIGYAAGVIEIRPDWLAQLQTWEEWPTPSDAYEMTEECAQRVFGRETPYDVWANNDDIVGAYNERQGRLRADGRMPFDEWAREFGIERGEE